MSKKFILLTIFAVLAIAFIALLLLKEPKLPQNFDRNKPKAEQEAPVNKTELTQEQVKNIFPQVFFEDKNAQVSYLNLITPKQNSDSLSQYSFSYFSQSSLTDLQKTILAGLEKDGYVVGKPIVQKEFTMISGRKDEKTSISATLIPDQNKMVRVDAILMIKK